MLTESHPTTAVNVATMAAIPQPTETTTHPDRLSIWIALGVVGIFFFQAIILIFCLIHGISRAKARWGQLRERGTITVDGPVAIWTNAIPPAPTVSTFNLQQALQASQYPPARHERRRIPTISPLFNPRVITQPLTPRAGDQT
jgi:hypothetical protein